MFNPQPKPEPRPKKQRKPLNRARKVTGEKILFASIWKIRKHFCENCKDFLGHEMKVHFFAHDIPKSRRNDLRLDANNITILCFDCHYAKDFQGEAKFNARKK